MTLLVLRRTSRVDWLMYWLMYWLIQIFVEKRNRMQSLQLLNENDENENNEDWWLVFFRPQTSKHQTLKIFALPSTIPPLPCARRRRKQQTFICWIGCCWIFRCDARHDWWLAVFYGRMDKSRWWWEPGIYLKFESFIKHMMHSSFTNHFLWKIPTIHIFITMILRLMY